MAESSPPLRDQILALLPATWRELEDGTGRTEAAISRQIIILEKEGEVVREKIPSPVRKGVSTDFWRVPKVLIRRA